MEVFLHGLHGLNVPKMIMNRRLETIIIKIHAFVEPETVTHLVNYKLNLKARSSLHKILLF